MQHGKQLEIIQSVPDMFSQVSEAMLIPVHYTASVGGVHEEARGDCNTWRFRGRL